MSGEPTPGYYCEWHRKRASYCNRNGSGCTPGIHHVWRLDCPPDPHPNGTGHTIPAPPSRTQEQT